MEGGLNVITADCALCNVDSKKAGLERYRQWFFLPPRDIKIVVLCQLLDSEKCESKWRDSKSVIQQTVNTSNNGILQTHFKPAKILD